MLERCSLFIIIALGETVLTTGTAIAQAPTDTVTLISGTFSLLGTIALWALAFGSVHNHLTRHLECISDPVNISRHAVNATTIMVSGLVVIAVASELIISHPEAQGTYLSGIMLGCGAITFLLAQSWYMHRILGIKSHTHRKGILFVAVTSCSAFLLPPIGVLILISSALTLLAFLDRKVVSKNQ